MFTLLGCCPIPHEQCSQRKAEQGNAAEHKVRVAPAMMIDNPLRHRRDKNGPNPAARKNESERNSSALFEPGEDGPCVGELGRSVGDETQYEVREVEAPDARTEHAQRRQRQREDHD